MYDPNGGPRRRRTNDPAREAAARDQRDEVFARRIQEIIGPRGRLISWESLDEGRWEARFSCDGLPFTVRREGATRVAAIDKAIKAANRLLGLRTAAFTLSNRISNREIEQD